MASISIPFLDCESINFNVRGMIISLHDSIWACVSTPRIAHMYRRVPVHVIEDQLKEDLKK